MTRTDAKEFHGAPGRLAMDSGRSGADFDARPLRLPGPLRRKIVPASGKFLNLPVLHRCCWASSCYFLCLFLSGQAAGCERREHRSRGRFLVYDRATG